MTGQEREKGIRNQPELGNEDGPDDKNLPLHNGNASGRAKFTRPWQRATRPLRWPMNGRIIWVRHMPLFCPVWWPRGSRLPDLVSSSSARRGMLQSLSIVVFDLAQRGTSLTA